MTPRHQQLPRHWAEQQQDWAWHRSGHSREKTTEHVFSSLIAVQCLFMLSMTAVVSWGADSGLPSSILRPIRLRWVRRSGALKCLVKASPGFSTPGTFSKSTSPDRICCWTQRSDVSKCRIFPTPSLRLMPMAAVASVRNSSERGIPRSAPMDLRPRPWLMPLAIPPSSASPDDNAIVL